MALPLSVGCTRTSVHTVMLAGAIVIMPLAYYPVPTRACAARGREIISSVGRSVSLFVCLFGCSFVRQFVCTKSGF